MKKEVAFFKRKITANDIIKTFRFAGFSDDQIIAEIKKWKKFVEDNKQTETAYTDLLQQMKDSFNNH